MVSVKALLFQKAAASLAVATALHFLKPLEIVELFIVAGHGHFILSYLYQWKAGKTSTLFFTSYLAVALLTFVWILQEPSLSLLILVSGGVFLIHQFNDEIRLFGLPPSRVTATATAVPAIAYFGILLDAVRYLPDTSLYIAVILGPLVFLLGYSYLYAKGREQVFVGYCASITIAASLVLIYLPHLPPPIAFGALIIYHYVSWYVYFADRLFGGPRFKTYVGEVVAINIAIVGVYLVLKGSVAPLLFTLFFTQAYFYGWTILHIFASSVQAFAPKQFGLQGKKA